MLTVFARRLVLRVPQPLRTAGIPVYGVSGSFADIDDVRAHGKDERIGVKEFYAAVDFMTALMKALAG